MLFGQKTHPRNFEYANASSVKAGVFTVKGETFTARIRCSEITPACARLSFDNSNVADKRNYSDGIIEAFRAGRNVRAVEMPVTFRAASCAIEMGASEFTIQLASGGILRTARNGFGFNGVKSILNFETTEATGFYGFGERTKRFNKSGDSMDFYNVDVCLAHTHNYIRDDYDPAYVSIPFAIIRSNGICTGLYIDNPERMVFDTGQVEPGHLICQSIGGNNDLYIINGPTLKDVVRNFTAITGRAEVPPIWSLGHHQCRWGYKTAAEFRNLRDKARQFDLPVSALWYDIDYMDEYRVFTWDQEDIPNPLKLNMELKRAGIRSVAIVDPGVKLEKGYSIYESGKKKDIFCKTRSRREFVGNVWPGDTVFPDFSIEPARDWWAGHLGKFIKEGALDGAWLDMNEPSTGWSTVDDMRFGNGAVAHEKYHNQYGHFMAKASRRAFEGNGSRPFLLTRSAFAGTQRYSAIWSGDNVSSWEHLRMSIPCTINLGLSGMAFNGPDVGGFVGHTDEELITRWYQAGFLFPFFRNHSTNHTKEQEPWNFGPLCLSRIREAVYTRYRLMPYLYNCFFVHYLTGDPILRPLLYEFDDNAFEDLDNQFMVGSSIMVAPILESGTHGNTVVTQGVRSQQRFVVLPQGWWFDLILGEWVEGGRTFLYRATLDQVPMFVRDGAIIPYYPGKFRNSEMNLTEVEIHIFCKERNAQLDYFIDDHESRTYLAGDYNKASIQAGNDGTDITVRITETGPRKLGAVGFTPVTYGSASRRLTFEYNGSVKTRTLKTSTRRWAGADVPVEA